MQQYLPHGNGSAQQSANEDNGIVERLCPINNIESQTIQHSDKRDPLQQAKWAREVTVDELPIKSVTQYRTDEDEPDGVE